MYCTEVMVKQHANISRMLKVIKEICCGILEGAEIDQKEFAEILDFIRRYADGHHHRREELVLFPEMVDHLEEVASIIIKHGMLVEHDLIRAHVRALDEALKLYAQEPKTEYKLQILTEAMAYANRLQQHVEKENNVVYPLADRGLSDDIKAKIDQTVKDMEAEEGPDFAKGYMDLLDRLEKKYKIAWGVLGGARRSQFAGRRPLRTQRRLRRDRLMIVLRSCTTGHKFRLYPGFTAGRLNRTSPTKSHTGDENECRRSPQAAGRRGPWDRIVGAVPKGGPALLIGELSAKLTERLPLN